MAKDDLPGNVESVALELVAMIKQDTPNRDLNDILELFNGVLDVAVDYMSNHRAGLTFSRKDWVAVGKFLGLVFTCAHGEEVLRELLERLEPKGRYSIKLMMAALDPLQASASVEEVAAAMQRSLFQIPVNRRIKAEA